MGFVDGKEGDGEALQPVHGAVECDALRRKIEQLVFAGGGVLKDVSALFRGSGGVQAGGGNPHLQELCDLVLHQGDQRRDDHRGGGVEDGG